MSDAPEDDVGARIRALREAAGLSQGQLAEMAGTNQQTVQRIEAGTTSNSRALPKLYEVLRHIDLRTHASSDELVRAYMTSYDQTNIKKEIKRKQYVPEHDDVEFISLVNKFFLNFSKEIEPGLMEVVAGKHVNFNLPDLLPSPDRVFALYVPTTDMEPEFEPGDILLADRLSPPIPNVTCLFLDGGEKKKVATIKRLLSSTKDEWRVKSWSPLREMTLPKSSWPECVRVIGKFSRR